MTHPHTRLVSCMLYLLMLSMLLLQLAACKQKPSDQEDSPESTESTQAAPDTELETRPAPVCGLSVRARSLALEGNTYKLTLDCTLAEGSTGGNITCTLSKDGSVIAEQTAMA